MNNIIIYGIPNCDTIKKTLNWFKKNKINFTFNDYKKLGISKQKLQDWFTKADWQIIFNKNSTTYKILSDIEKEKLQSQKEVVNFMIENTSSIKRPIIEFDNKIYIGFNEKMYQQLFKK